MRKGFTLIELLVVIAIIGLLSSVVFASLNSARAKARDARRKADLAQISKALELYYDKYNKYEVANSGYGSDAGPGCGCGWFGYEDAGAYKVSVSRALFNEGFLGNPRVDDPQQNPGYMIYYCDRAQRYAVSATLENPTPADIAYIDTTCNGSGSNGTHTVYGKNYAVGN